MNIKVTDRNASENFLAHYKTQWEIRIKKNRSRWMISYLMSAGITLLSAIKLFTAEEVSRQLLFKFNADSFFLAFGLTYGFFILQSHLAFIKQHKANLAYLQGVCECLRKGGNESIMTLTDEFVIIEQYQSYEKTGWEYFSNYSLHDNLLILYKNPAVIENIVVDKNLISKEEFDELLYFVTEKLAIYNI